MNSSKRRATTLNLIPGFCSVANGRRGCSGGGAGVGVGMDEESGSMMPEEPCDGKSPPRSRGDRP